MESLLGVKGERGIRLVQSLPPTLPSCVSHQGFLFYFLYLSCFISLPNSNVSMGKKEILNKVILVGIRRLEWISTLLVWEGILLTCYHSYGHTRVSRTLT